MGRHSTSGPFPSGLHVRHFSNQLRLGLLIEIDVDNVDYNEIKHLIKRRTTRSHGQAISIPSQGHEGQASAEFEEELHTELHDQHQRIDLFVQSKTGELERRLDHLLKQILRLTHQIQSTSKKPISIKRLEKFAKAESEVLKVGEEIQSLAQFVAAQRLAFRKLLKKYRKWTGSDRLGVRFQSEILRRRSNFSQKDFGPLLEQWTGVLATVRAPFEAGLSWKPGRENLLRPTSSKAAFDRNRTVSNLKQSNSAMSKTTSAADLATAYSTGSDVDVDTEFATVPLGNTAGRAAYWIHSDDFVQLHILLLQHTRIRRPPAESSFSPTFLSTESSRRTSLQSSANSRVAGMQDEIGIILCDNLQRFAERQNGATIGAFERVPGSLLEAATVSMRYSSKGEATVVINNLPIRQHGVRTSSSTESVKKAKMKRKMLSHLFSSDKLGFSRPSSDKTDFDSGNEPESPDDAIEDVQHWLAEHPNIVPLVHLNVQRTRFVGLGNNKTKGIWAMLDKSILMKKWSVEDLNDFSRSIPANFPHAVLEIRWEGIDQPDLVKQLEETHLTERVHGFSLTSHAITTICRPQGILPPSWLPTLDRDIRKVPARPSLSRRQSAAIQRSPRSTSNERASTPATSAVDGQSSSDFSAVLPLESPATSVPEQLKAPPLGISRKKRHTQKGHPLGRQISASTATPERYWNEFDDGEEALANEAYTIFVDPNAQSSFPGVASITNLFTAVSIAAKTSSENVKAWLLRSSRIKSDERQPLVGDYFDQRPSAEDTDFDSDNSSAEYLPNSRRYSTFPTRRYSTQAHAAASRESLLARGCVASFFASVILLVIATVLTSTARRRYIRTADVGTLVGVVSSLVFGALGMGMMIARKENAGWGQRSVVFALFAMMCAGNAVLLLAVVRS